MKYLKHLLPLLFTAILISCGDDDDNNYKPEFTASNDIKNEIDFIENVINGYAAYIDTVTHEKRLEYGYKQYKSFIDLLPQLKKEVQAKADDINWPENYPATLAQEERLQAFEYITVIDSISETSNLYYNSIKELIESDGKELLFLFNSCKAFIDNLDFSSTSYADISKKYTILKRSSLIKQLNYFQLHKRKPDVDFFLDNAPNIELVWDFVEATLYNYINRTNLIQLAADSTIISSSLTIVNSLENSQEIYDSLFYANSYNPIEKKLTSYNTLHNFATSLPEILTAEDYISFAYSYIYLLQNDIDSVKNNVDTIQSRLPDNSTHSQFISSYNKYYPDKTASLITAFEFPVILSELLIWGDDYSALVYKTEPLYATYLNKDTITNTTDIDVVNKLEQQSIDLTDRYLTRKYHEYYSRYYSDIIDEHNRAATGGKIFYLMQLLE